jgi:hypothetical protein
MKTILNLKVSSDLLKTDCNESDLDIIGHIEEVLSQGNKTLKQMEEESSCSPNNILDTALNYYIFFGKYKIVQYLIENQKANLLMQDDNGNTVMHCLANLSFHIDTEENLKNYQLMTDYLLSKYDLALRNKSNQSMVDIFLKSIQKQTQAHYSYYSNAILNKNYTFYLQAFFERWYLANVVEAKEDEKGSGTKKI